MHTRVLVAGAGYPRLAFLKVETVLALPVQSLPWDSLIVECLLHLITGTRLICRIVDLDINHNILLFFPFFGVEPNIGS